MLNKFLACLLFFFAFMVNASFSLITDFVLNTFDLSEQTVFYVILTLLIYTLIWTIKSKNIDYRLHLILSTFFLCFVLWSFSGNAEYGMSKAFLALVIPYLSLLILSVRKWTVRDLENSLLCSCFAVLLVAILYKIGFGLFERSVRFGLFGPITFGWVMSFGAIVSLTRIKEKIGISPILMLAVFLAAVFWSGSKGPLIALAIVMSWLVVREYSIPKIATISALGVLALLLLSDYLLETRTINTFVRLYEDPLGYMEGAGQGSVGSRFGFYKLSLTLFLDQPLTGIGFGNWGEYETYTTHYYPHNLVLELLAEAGIIGILFLLFILYYFSTVGRSTLKYAATVAIVAMMFSGDFSYFRYPLFFILLCRVGSASLLATRPNTKPHKTSFPENKI